MAIEARQAPAIGRRTAAREVRSPFVLSLVALPGVLTLIVFSMPTDGAPITSMNFRVLLGVTYCRWVGPKNRRAVFSTPGCGSILTNTVAISIQKLLFGLPLPIARTIRRNEARHAGDSPGATSLRGCRSVG